MEKLTIRGSESVLNAFRDDLAGFLKSQHIAADAMVGVPAPARKSITDRSPLGHNDVLQFVIDVGGPFAAGVLSAVAKDLLVAWIKDKVKKYGLTVESKDNTG